MTSAPAPSTTALGDLDRRDAARASDAAGTTPRGVSTVADYDALIDASPQGSIYCRPWWLDAVAPGRWCVHEERRGGVLHAAWPVVTDVDAPETVVMPPLTQKLGILLAPAEGKYAERLSREHDLSAALAARLPRTGAVRHRFHETFTDGLALRWQGFDISMNYTYVLPDLHDLDRVWDDVRPKTRTAVRKAERSGLTVTRDVSLDAFLACHDHTFARQDLDCPVPEATIRRLDAACVAHDARRILGAVDDAGTLHAALYLGVGRRHRLLPDGRIRRHGRLRDALRLLIWEAVRTAVRVATRFDFEGSMIPGVEHVCRGFGARQTPYLTITRPARPTLRSIARRTLADLRRWKGDA